MQAFEAEGLRVNIVSGRRYIGAYVVPEKERNAWVRLQVECWEYLCRLCMGPSHARDNPYQRSAYSRFHMEQRLHA